MPVAYDANAAYSASRGDAKAITPKRGPPSWAADAKRTLPNAVTLDVDGVGHNTTGVACVRSLMADFVKGTARAGDPALAGRLDACAHALKRPAFFTSYAGPEP